MAFLGRNRVARVVGDDAVLERLARLGSSPRVFEGMVRAGFPAAQLAEAVKLYVKSAETPLERYAGQQMLRGIFEDESLLQLLTRYYECAAWRLEARPWICAPTDDEQFTQALLKPVEFHTARLRTGEGDARWAGSFVKLPFDLGMERAKRSLWHELMQLEYYWRPRHSYVQHRAAQMFGYLCRTMEPSGFSPHKFSYAWERRFRERFAEALEDFTEALGARVRQWQEARQETRGGRFEYQRYEAVPPLGRGALGVNEARRLLGMESAEVTVHEVRRCFRRRSMELHPDRGGSPEAFRRLVDAKETLEAWLSRRN
jgi:hypothetical protein